MLGVLKHLTLILVIPNGSSASSSSVDTLLGRIVGLHDKTESGEDYLKFEGIPYAEAPVGPLRFLPPVPVKAWQGDLVADTDRGACPQVSIFPPLNVYSGHEDCLFLNVYTKGKGDSLLPVMIWIHGGAFIINRATEDSQFISPDQESLSLMSKWSAPVFNYRLTYEAKNSPILNIIGANEMDIGVFHGDDLLYFFNSPVNPLVNDDERKLAREMLTFWSNFAKSGSPGSNWKPFTTEHKNYMDLKPTPELKEDMVADRMDEWQAVVWADREASLGKETAAQPSPLC